MSTHQYQEDSDFDEAFKHLLQPNESIIKKDSCEIMQYDLIKALESYSKHLKKSPTGSSTVFVEAAIIIQNISLIYQKRADVTINAMMKLVGKFRSYRLNENVDPDYCSKKRVENKIKKNSKKVKCYSFFGPIESQIVGSLKNFDCKQINLRKLPPVKKIVLNTNIKVENKYSKILPYICNANKENIGKKYDFKINFPLDFDLAVSEEFYCPTKEDSTSKNLINYKNNTNSLPINLLDAFNSKIIYQKVIDEVSIPNNISSNSIHELNVSQLTQNGNDPRAQVLNAEHSNCTNKPHVKKKDLRIKDEEMMSSMYMNGTGFHFLVHDEEMEELLKIDESNESIHTQRKSIDMQNYEKNIMETDEEMMSPMHMNDTEFHFLVHDEEMEESLEIDESNESIQTSQRNSIDVQNYEKNIMETDEEIMSPMHMNDTELHSSVHDEEIEESLEIDESNESVQTSQRNSIDMQNYEKNIMETMNEQLEMQRRVVEWHNKLKPILEKEEKTIEFDIHEYGTRILSCFESIGEQKLFTDLVGGLDEAEVSRYYLSLLMMVNTNNFEISNHISGEDFLVKLLKKDRHHEELQVNIGNQMAQNL